MVGNIFLFEYGTGIQPVMPVQSYQGHNSSNQINSAFLDAFQKVTSLVALKTKVIVKDYLSSKISLPKFSVVINLKWYKSTTVR